MITISSTLSYERQTVPPIIPAVQGDTGRNISFTISDYEIPEGASAAFYIQKPSGEAIYNTAEIVSSNVVNVPLDAQCLAEAGENFGQVRILLDDEVITSFSFILLVKVFHGVDAIESLSEMNVFDQAVADAAADFQTEAEQIAAEVIESIPSDYTALSNDVTGLKQDLFTLGTRVDFDIISTLKKTNKSGGVSYTFSNDGKTCNVQGTQSGTSFSWLEPTGTIPFGIVPGSTYVYKYSSSNVYFEIWNGSTRLLSATNSGMITIPTDVNEVSFRLSTWNANNINETVTLPTFTNVTVNGEITLNSSVWFETSSTNAIIEALKITNCHLEPGTYEVSKQISIPNGKTLSGCGENTVLKYIGASSSFILCPNGNETIKDIVIDGGLSARPATYSPSTPITGITINTEVNAPTFISNVRIKGFSKNGILIENRGYASLCSIIGDNIICQYCGCGICFYEKGEYGVLSNSVCIDNYYGCIDSGGNNKIANCGFDRNTVGLFADAVYNNTHSDVISCSFNHCIQYGVFLNNITSPLTFTACQFYGAGDRLVTTFNIKASSFANCMFGNGTIGLNGGSTNGLNLFTGCVFEAQPTFIVTNNPVVIFAGCYDVTGQPVNVS